VVRFSALWSLYRRWLEVHAAKEVWAGFGIAVGVALVFAVQVANGSITTSAKQILHRITGDASVQLAARDPRGFDGRMVELVRGLPGVERAAPLLEQRATIVYGGRRVAVDFVGIDRELSSLGGVATGNFLLGGLFLERAIMLPEAMADALRLPALESGRADPNVVLEMRGRATRVRVGAVVGEGVIGSALANAMLAGASMPYAQELAGLPGRITRVLVVPKLGRGDEVRAALRALGGGRLTVADVDAETRLLDQATGPNDQATNLTAIISGIVGLLLTFNAMLLTMPERRQLVADLRIQGFRKWKIVQVLGFQAILLGAVASFVGLGVGWLLLRTTANNPPGYLALAFPLGVERVIDWQTVGLAFFGGIAATCLAAGQPLGDLRRGRAVDAVYLEEISEPGNELSARTRWALAFGAIGLVAATSVLLFVIPEATIVGIAALALATLLALPAVSLLILAIAEVPAEGWRMNMLVLALRALRATTLRSLALAATGGVAIFGSIAIESSHQNLLDGLYQDYREYVSTADLWIAHPSDDLALQPFDDGAELARRVRAVPGVATVRPYYGGLLDLHGRRAWIIARANADTPLIPPSQIIDGSLASASARLRAGGWATVSEQIADAQNLGVGETIRLPTPTGNVDYRIAATTTNLGWGPGAIVLGSRDYQRAWASTTPSALEVRLAPGADPNATKHAIARALGPNVALGVQTTAERAEHANALARAGLARLSQISTLLLIAAALAMAAAMSTAIWQRRPVLAQLRIQGGRSRQLRRALLLEAGLVLSAGCLTGAITGFYGHYLLDRWLQLTTGYPAPYSPVIAKAALTCLLVSAAALLATAYVGHHAANAPTNLALDS
jgi:putative ABC transport system permease protein